MFRNARVLTGFGSLVLVATLGLILIPANRSPEDRSSAQRPRSSSLQVETETPMSTLLPPPTETPEFPNPILTAQEAISRSLALFPSSANPHGEVARLLTFNDLDQWRRGSSPGTAPQSPAWLVGILGDNLTMFGLTLPRMGYAGLSDPQLPPDIATEAPASDWPVEGAFYAWDANSGILVGEGVLSDPALVLGSYQSYASLVALPSNPLPISSATPYPTMTAFPTLLPGVTPVGR